MIAESTKRRKLDFKDEAEVIADVERLRKGCATGGRWSLEQACWHLEYPIAHSMNDAAGREPTPMQLKFQGSLDQLIANGWPTSTINAPPEMAPPADAGPEAIDLLLSTLRTFQSIEAPTIDAFRFGPIETSKMRRFMLIHAGHHLEFFEVK